MDDANELINLANQMGFFDDKIQKHTPNASRCLTKSAINKTNREKHEKRVLRMEDIYGMLLILSVGLAGALLAFAAEHIAHKRHSLTITKRIFHEGKKIRLIMERFALAMIEKWAEIKLDKPPKRAKLPKLNLHNRNPLGPSTKAVNKV